MRAYEVSSNSNSTYAYGTLSDAHFAAKMRVIDGEDWRDVSITEIEVMTDKANLLRLVNNEGGTHIYLRRFEFKTPRLGLEEVPLETTGE